MIEIQDVSKQFDCVTALRHLTLKVQELITDRLSKKIANLHLDGSLQLMLLLQASL